MSMPIIERPENPIDRDQAINDLIESVALIETGLSHIVNAEGEKIQKVVNADSEPSVDDMIRVNDSVSKMVSNVSKLEMMLQSKLEITKEIEDGSTPIEIEYGTIIPYRTTLVTMTTSGMTSDYDVACPGFGGEAQRLSTSNLDEIVQSGVTRYGGGAFMMPRDGIITSLSAYLEIGADSTIGGQSEMQVMARLYSAPANSIIYTSINGTTVALTPIISPDFVGTLNVNGDITSLNISVPRNTKLLLVFYLETDGIANITNALIGGGLNIR